MRRGIILLAACAVQLLMWSRASFADEEDFACGTVGEDTSQAVTNEINFIFVAFQNTEDHLPAWSDTLAQQLRGFLDFASNGNHVPQVRIIKRQDDSTKAWVMDHDTQWYDSPMNCIDSEMRLKVQAQWGSYPGHTIGYIYYVAPGDSIYWACGEPIGEGGEVEGEDFKVRLMPNQLVDAAANARWVPFGIIHEYGHLLFGPTHFPTYRGPAGRVYGNLGRYDGAMKLSASGLYNTEGLLPYDPLRMVIRGWIETMQIDQLHYPHGVQGLHIPDLHDRQQQPKSKIVEVLVPGSDQWYMLVNHQGRGLDAKYQGTGLLVWHVFGLHPPGYNYREVLWDIESAAGKFRPGLDGWAPGPPDPIPDPEWGVDELERNPAFLGAAEDFFGDGRSFNGCTNPSTDLYRPDALFGLPCLTTIDSTCAANAFNGQQIYSGVFIQNIHKDLVSNDMIMDIHWGPDQEVLSPNGGEAIVVGDSVTVHWNLWDCGVIGVDLAWSADSGGSFVPWADSLPNTGSYRGVLPEVPGSHYRVQVTTHQYGDEGELTPGIDMSNADFTVWGVNDAGVNATVSQNCNGTVKFDITWWTSAETQGNDVIEIASPDSSMQATRSEYHMGLFHHMQWEGPCQASNTEPWTYRVKSSLAGGVASSSTKQRWITECISCPPPCRPSCEFE